MDNKRQKILDSALELFVSMGFHGTSTGAIAKNAEVANGTLFHYFKTKEELINVLYLELKQKFIEYVFSGIHAKSSFSTRIRKIWLRSLNYSFVNRKQHKFLLQYYNSPYLSSNTQSTIDIFFENFYKPIEEGISSGVLADLPIKMIYAVASHHIFAVIEYLNENEDKISDIDFMEKAYQSFWKSISK